MSHPTSAGRTTTATPASNSASGAGRGGGRHTNHRGGSGGGGGGRNRHRHATGANNTNDGGRGSGGRGRGGGGGGISGGVSGGRHHGNPSQGSNNGTRTNQQQQQQQQHHHHPHKHGKNDNKATLNKGGGGGSGGGSGGGGGNNVQRVIIKNVELIESTGMGETPAQQAVTRIPARILLNMRLKFIEPPEEPGLFTPHLACHWTAENRLAELLALSQRAIELGDVSKKSPPIHETAPPLEECKPLQVNEETRWKPKLMKEASTVGAVDGEETNQQSEEETTEQVVAKALLILNKVSWTTLEKLTIQFMEDTKLAEDEMVRKAIIDMLVHKANTEPHFGPMYAQLCATIAKQVKPFKKELLSQCQKEFEVDTAHKIAKAIEGVDDPDEQNYRAQLIRKAYIGHMKFLGELYKRDVVKLAIMMYCLDELLKEEENEENLECFVSLMTTMGEKLDDHAKQNNKPFDWGKVNLLSTSSKISNRIRYLLQDLLDLKERGKRNCHTSTVPKVLNEKK